MAYTSEMDFLSGVSPRHGKDREARLHYFLSNILGISVIIVIAGIHTYTIFYKYRFSRYSLDDASSKPLHT